MNALNCPVGGRGGWGMAAPGEGPEVRGRRRGGRGGEGGGRGRRGGKG